MALWPLGLMVRIMVLFLRLLSRVVLAMGTVILCWTFGRRDLLWRPPPWRRDRCRKSLSSLTRIWNDVE
jgi:hypothetical protein